jgi:tetratricopeptide (TPR) repeat protein
MSNSAKEIFDLLPARAQEAVKVLSVPSLLTQEIAHDLIEQIGLDNDNPTESVNQVKKFPIWQQRSASTWSLHRDIRVEGQKRLNGSGQKTIDIAVEVLKEHRGELSGKTITEQMDYDLQLARLEIKSNDVDNGAKQIRSFYDTAKLVHDFNIEKLVVSYINESNTLFKNRDNWSESLLSIAFIKGQFEYENKRDDLALEYFIPVWKHHGESISSKFDAGIASHLVGRILTKKEGKRKDAENALLDSIRLRSEVADEYGLIQTYLTAANFYNKFKESNASFFDKAVEYYELALKSETDRKNWLGVCRVYNSLGNFYSRTDFSKALDYFTKSKDLLKYSGNDRELGYVYHELGNLYSRNKLFYEAEAAYLESVRVREKFSDREGLAQTYTSYGRFVGNKLHDKKKAIQLLTKALEYERKNDYRKQIESEINKLK